MRGNGIRLGVSGQRYMSFLLDAFVKIGFSIGGTLLCLGDTQSQKSTVTFVTAR